MAKKHKLGGLINENNLDHWLSSSGYLYPRTEPELNLFEKAIADFEFKLENKSIDIESIVNGALTCHKNVISLISDEDKTEINTLKMAARKGDQSIPKEILDKMKDKHKNGNK